MSTTVRPTVEHCHTMADVRRNIDALDDRIVALVAERSAYVAQAARIKQSAGEIVDNARIEFIVDRVRAQARAAGAPEAVLEAAYRAMIAASIDFERGEFQRLRQEA
ncbi:chorismate mutase [Polaromonas sp. JS666]|uniref:chorismate mutase n=1 Tax=Polaromonas sp. (strain JS666 / ATCC BAA-500) TaxID=296591 RepID=UPI0008839565|nr:chorismate mutase [Polaromonas sp. JS666]SDN76123.1 isochorismate pyruvate lyase [Polaromonas sp. JS666]